MGGNDSELIARIDERTERILKDNENYRKDIKELFSMADDLRLKKASKEELNIHANSNIHLTFYSVLAIITIISSIGGAVIIVTK